MCVGSPCRPVRIVRADRANPRGRSEGKFGFMGFDRGRRGKGRDKRDGGFGEEGFDPGFGGGGFGGGAHGGHR